MKRTLSLLLALALLLALSACGDHQHALSPETEERYSDSFPFFGYTYKTSPDQIRADFPGCEEGYSELSGGYLLVKDYSWKGLSGDLYFVFWGDYLHSVGLSARLEADTGAELADIVAMDTRAMAAYEELCREFGEPKDENLSQVGSGSYHALNAAWELQEDESLWCTIVGDPTEGGNASFSFTRIVFAGEVDLKH